MIIETATSNAAKIAKEHKLTGQPVYNACMGTNPLEAPSILLNILCNSAKYTNYGSSTPIPELQTALQEHYPEHPHILVGNGLKELIFMTILNWKHDIYVITPCWLSYIEQCKVLGREKERKMHYINTTAETNYKVNPSVFEINKDKPKLLIFNSPNNPTGIVYTEDELHALSKPLLEYNWTVLSDEIYRYMCYNNKKAASLSTHIPENVIIGSSLSKDVACGGYRFGWLLFPDNLQSIYEEMKYLASNIYTCPTTPLHYVAFLRWNKSSQRELERYMQANNVIFSQTTSKCIEYIKNHSKIIVPYPDATYYLFLDFEYYRKQLYVKYGIQTDTELVDKLTDIFGVITIPGCVFYPSGDYNKLQLRYAMTDFNANNIIIGIHKICDFVK
jgi:aspartate aminotransferase